MEESKKQKFMNYYIDKAIKEPSLSGRATCFFCEEKITEEERYRVSSKYPNSTHKYIHTSCINVAIDNYRQAMDSKKLKIDEKIASSPETIKNFKLDQQNLEIWYSYESPYYWTNKYGEIKPPEGWDYLPSGNTYLTRTVKNLGPYWSLKEKKQVSLSKHNKRMFSPVIGIWAPSENINKAEEMEELTNAERYKKREKAAIYRDKKEVEYKNLFCESISGFLNFSASNKNLAIEIAEETSKIACEKGSGRVGRTGMLPLSSKVKLATIAYIRHNYTDYHSELSDKCCADNDEMYREVKMFANSAAWAFIDEHRE